MTAADPALSEPAPAKINLFLHLRGRRADGYHLLDSLAVFPAIGDTLRHDASRSPGSGPGHRGNGFQSKQDGITLRIDGPFGPGLSADADNLVLRAARALAGAHGLEPEANLHLEKHLPVASGIGGGSSDAAAALRLLSRLWGVAIPDGLALALGADVPVCLTAPQPRLMAGIGEQLTAPPPLPAFWMVLANPGVAVETGAVFAAVEQRDNPPGPPPPPMPDFAALVDWLDQTRNDLQAAAQSLCPAVADVLTALGDAPLARMSGSGATCFALHETEAQAMPQAERLRQARPGWWITAARVSEA